MRLSLLAVLLFCPGHLAAQTVFDSELWVSSKTGVGTASPGARFEARGTSSTASVFQASGVDLSPALRVGADGTLGLSTASAARVTVSGSGDAGDLALELRGGNLYPAEGNNQVTFGYAGGALYRHSIRSTHANAVSSNSLTFSVWNGADAAASTGTRAVLALLTHSTGTTLHVLPPPVLSTYTVQLIVSDGANAGAGTMRRKAEGSVSSAFLKEDIQHLGPEAEQAAYAEVGGLRHVGFRYKVKKGKGGRLLRGLLYEEAPPSVQAGGGAVSFDRRLLNAEMAARELISELESAQAEVEGLKGAGR